MQQLGILLFSLFGATGFFVWWRALLKLRSKQPLLEYRERTVVGENRFAFFAATVWIVLLLASRFIGPETETPPNIQAQVIASLTVLSFLLMLLALTKGQTLADFGIHFDQLRQQVADGVIGFFASVVPVMLVLLATSGLRKKETQHSFLKLLESDPGWETILWIGLAAVVVAPAIEELLFRVILQGTLTQRMKPTAAIGIVAVIFSCVHDWPDLLPLFPLAIILGYVYHQRHSYLAVVVLHALFNAMNLLNALLLQSK